MNNRCSIEEEREEGMHEKIIAIYMKVRGMELNAC